MEKRQSALVAAVIGNLIIIFPFAKALLDPLNNIEFIFNTAPLLFIVEFLSIHSAGMLLSNSSKQMGKARYFLIPFYTLFALGMGLAVGNIYPPVVFLLSLVVKLTFHRATPEGEVKIIVDAIVLVSTVFAVVIFADFLSSIFPFSNEVMRQKPTVSAGFFVDTPQTALIWGLLYYGLAIFFEVKRFKNPKFLSSLSKNQQR
jgi:hypothetical protein